MKLSMKITNNEKINQKNSEAGVQIKINIKRK